MMKSANTAACALLLVCPILCMAEKFHFLIKRFEEGLDLYDPKSFTEKAYEEGSLLSGTELHEVMAAHSSRLNHNADAGDFQCGRFNSKMFSIGANQNGKQDDFPLPGVRVTKTYYEEGTCKTEEYEFVAVSATEQNKNKYYKDKEQSEMRRIRWNKINKINVKEIQHNRVLTRKRSNSRVCTRGMERQRHSAVNRPARAQSVSGGRPPFPRQSRRPSQSGTPIITGNPSGNTRRLAASRHRRMLAIRRAARRRSMSASGRSTGRRLSLGRSRRRRMLAIRRAARRRCHRQRF